MKSYFIDRFSEASTWRGVTLLLTALGIPLAPGVADMIIAVGLSVTGLIGALTPDK
jgi:hypothetical protein